MLDMNFYIIGIVIGIVILLILAVYWVFNIEAENDKNKQDIINELKNYNETVYATYQKQIVHASHLIADIYYLYEFNFNNKKIFIKFYPQVKDGTPPIIPNKLEINKDFLDKISPNHILYIK
jgi:hypothetical protein